MKNLFKYIPLGLFFILCACKEHEEKSIIGAEQKKEEIQEKKQPEVNYASIYPGGKVIYRAVDGDICLSILNDSGTWSTFSKLEGNVNSLAEESNPALSPDGKQLYFTSDRPGGIGGKDLYISEKIAIDSWSDPINLGPAINTKLDEDMPYVSKDGERFYYISKSHQSIGGYDVFMSEVKETGFAISEAMSDINTVNDDFLYSYFLSEGYAVKTDKISGVANLVIVNVGFKDIIVGEKSKEQKGSSGRSASIKEYLKGDVSYHILLSAFGDVKINNVHYEIQIGASKGELSLSEEVKQLGKIVVRDVSNGYKRYSLGLYESLNEVNETETKLKDLGYKDAFVNYYVNGEKTTLTNILKKYVDEVGS